MPQPPEEAPPRPDPLLGRIIANNFRLERLLGAGGMGNVYRAEQMSLGKPVAVKILHEDLMGDEVVVKRFEREARSASRLEHPNLVQIIDFGQDRATGVLFIAMELLSGRDLGQVITQDAPLPLHRIVRIMAQVLSALEEAHLQGVIHRDLKPANIMLVDRRGEQDLVKVCDFGIAKSSSFTATGNPSMLTVRGFVCGTPEYMAPEQARGEDVDGRTDLYAAAVILYQMVTGQVPFTASSPVAILSQHLDHEPTPPSRKRPDLPPALDALILMGLSKDPDGRPPTAAAFRQSLEAVCSISAQGQLATAASIRRERTPTVPAVTRPARRPSDAGRRWGHLALLGALMVGVGIAAAATLRSHVLRGPSVAVDMVPPPPRAAAPPPPAAVAPAAEAPRPEPAHEDPPRRRASRPAHLREPAPAEAPARRAPIVDPAPPEPARPAAAPAPHEPLAEADRLLSQGETAQACARGEEARQQTPRVAAIYRFLGKCYMRLGNAARASERYRVYLELQPDAPDAAFIKSLVK